MSIIPSWAPNVHPLIIHFPIVLIVLAVTIDFINLYFRQIWVRKSVVSLYLLSALGVIAAYLSGKQAADSVQIAPQAISVLNNHADWAEITVWFVVVYSLIRLIVAIKKWDQRNTVKLLSVLIAAPALFLISETAEHGGELVYKYSTGVAELNTENLLESAIPEDPINDIVTLSNGSWKWHLGRNAEVTLRSQFKWLSGSVTNLNSAVQRDSTYGIGLVLRPDGDTNIFITGESFVGMQTNMILDIDQFDGEISLIHHVQDSLTYDFIALRNSRLILGRMEGGRERIFDEKAVKFSGRQTLGLIVEGRHFRGYLNNKLEAHGHSGELPPGPVGMLIKGTGSVKIYGWEVVSLN